MLGAAKAKEEKEEGKEEGDPRVFARGMHISCLKPPVLAGTPLKKEQWPQSSPELPDPRPATQAHLIPWPQMCEGRKNTPKPTSDPWAKSFSFLAALPRPSSACRQLPLDFTFQLIVRAAVVVTWGYDDIFRALCASFCRLPPGMSPRGVRGRPGCRWPPALRSSPGKGQPPRGETAEPAAGGGGRDAAGLAPNSPGCLGRTDLFFAPLPPGA